LTSDLEKLFSSAHSRAE